MDRYVVIVGFVMLVVSTTAAQLAATSRPRVPASTHVSLAKPVARINGAVLTEADLQREMSAMFPYAQQHGGKVPKSMEAEVRRGALQMIEFEDDGIGLAAIRAWVGLEVLDQQPGAL